jgi:hypothetical protein
MPVQDQDSAVPGYGYGSGPGPVSLIVGGTARDCAAYLPGAFARLDALARGRRVYYVFYESNSTDDTLHLLRQFVRGRAGRVFAETTSGTRTERIAAGRNAVIEHVESVARYDPYDFFINLDLDDRCQFDVRSVRECLARSDEWDIASASQSVEYYDRWALRTSAMGDMYDGRSHCIVGYGHLPAQRGAVCDASVVPPISRWFPGRRLERMRTFPRTAPYFSVQSAFGSLAIYKTWLLRGARYSGVKPGNAGVPECEHVPFHAAIASAFPGARIVIAPYMISGP